MVVPANSVDATAPPFAGTHFIPQAAKVLAQNELIAAQRDAPPDYSDVKRPVGPQC
jgi:hypothetical protein